MYTRRAFDAVLFAFLKMPSSGIFVNFMRTTPFDRTVSLVKFLPPLFSISLIISVKEPAFGLMSRADKLKLDAIVAASDSFLTKSAASTTYTTKSETNALSDTFLTKSTASTTYATKSYIASVEQTNDGFVFKNGNGVTVATIPTLKDTRSPNLTLSSNGATVYWQPDGAKNYRINDLTFTFTRDGDGVVSASSDVYFIEPSVSGNTVTLAFNDDSGADINATITVTCAATTEYDAQDATFTVTAEAV